jgi:hypothetical protein
MEFNSALYFCSTGWANLTRDVVAVSKDESLLYDRIWRLTFRRTLYTLDDCVTEINSLPDPPAAYTTSDIYLRGAATELSGMTTDFVSVLDNPNDNTLVEKAFGHIQKFNIGRGQVINARPK